MTENTLQEVQFVEVASVETVRTRQLLFYTKGVKVESDGYGNLYFNGKEVSLKNSSGNLYTAYGLIYRYKKPKRVLGARKRKKALAASVRKYAVRINFVKED